ncbi:MAG TPA: methylmalonyl-CoA mutase family protein, partial [Aeromicrobium sp.]|nr:methylmalonyl-CoA mutase family protein [Aeromicrobium sp.]
MAPETMAAELSLAEGSAEHTLADWERATAAVLRKSGRLGGDASDSDVWGLLTKQTLDGIDVTPLGTLSLTEDLPDVGLPGQSPYTRGSGAVREFGAWDIRAQFVDPDPKVTAGHLLTDLENGVNSLWLSVGPTSINVGDLPDLLEKVFIDLAPVILDAPGDPVGAAEALAAIFESRSLEPAPGTNLGANPIGARVDEATTKHVVTEVAAIATKLGARALVVDGTDVHDSGASDVQELAYSLAVGASYLRLIVDAGYSVDDAAGLIEFRYAATDEQFPTIAKFRAARRLWNRVAELSGVAAESRAQVQHGVTSRPMMTTYGSYINMLRTTVAAFAAGIGGAVSVTVLPFDVALGLPENFSRRIARNTSSLLILESHVAQVMDPVGGAYVIEKLTDDLARAAWAAFGAIEDAGGIAAVLADGSLDAEIAETVKKRTGEIGKRTRQITGVNEFPDLAQALPERRAYPDGATVVARYGAPFEA